jgi:hypothetical protein
METEQTFVDRKELVKYLQKKLDKYKGCKYDLNNLTVKEYMIDARIGWDTYIVHLEDFGVLGFTNGPVSKEVTNEETNL